MPDELRKVATVSNEAEAEMVIEELSEAGIHAMAQISAGGIRLGAAAGRDIYVGAADYERALEAINAAVPSEAELAALSDAAAQQAPGEPGEQDEPHPAGQ